MAKFLWKPCCNGMKWNLKSKRIIFHVSGWLYIYCRFKKDISIEFCPFCGYDLKDVRTIESKFIDMGK